MIKRRLMAFISAAMLSLVALLTFSGTAYAVGGTCTWTGGGNGVSFNDASNWSGCSGAPVPAADDNLIFNNTTLPSTTTLNNNLTGLVVNNITFSGSGTHGFVISGNGISIGGGVIDSGSGSAQSEMDADLTLAASLSFTNSSTGAGNLLFDGVVDLNGFTLTSVLTHSNDSFGYFNGLTGSGNLVFDGISGGANYGLDASSPNLDAPIDIKNNAVVIASDDNFQALGTGTVTVENGGALEIESTLDSGELDNNLVLAGSGTAPASYGALISCLGDSSGCTTDDDTTLFLAGTVDFQGNIQVVNGAFTGSAAPPNTATFDFAGDAVSNGFTLTATANSNTEINNDPLDDSLTPGVPDTGVGISTSSGVRNLAIGVSLVLGALTIITVGLRKFAKVYLKRR